MIEPERQYAIRHSRVSQKRRDLERKVADQMRQELDHARIETTLKHYARDERDAFSNREDGTDREGSVDGKPRRAPEGKSGYQDPGIENEATFSFRTLVSGRS